MKMRSRLPRRRPRLSYANVMATIAVFGVLGGGAYATHTHRMGTQDLQNRAVTAPKLADGAVIQRAIRNRAVRPRQIADNAVRGRSIARGVPGVAAAGAMIQSNGVVRRWFNRFGGRPNVDHPDTGLYDITFPGLEGRLHPFETVASLSVRGSPAMIARGGSDDVVLIEVHDADGDRVDRAFEIVLMRPGPP